MGFSNEVLQELEQGEDTPKRYLSVAEQAGYDDDRLNREIRTIEDTLKVGVRHSPGKTMDDKLRYICDSMRAVISGETQDMSEDEIERARIRVERSQAKREEGDEHYFEGMLKIAETGEEEYEGEYDFYQSMTGGILKELEGGKEYKTYRLVKDLMVLTRAEKGML